MKVQISIELEEGEPLARAVRSIMGTVPVDLCEPAEEPEKTPKPKRKAAPKKAHEPEEAEAKTESEPEPESKKSTETSAEKPKKPKGVPTHQVRIRSAAMAAINNGKRDEVETLLDPYGGLKGVPKEDAEDLLAKIEAL